MNFVPATNWWRLRLACPDAGWAGGFTRDGDAKIAGATNPQQNYSTKAWATDSYQRCISELFYFRTFLFRNPGDDQMQQLERSAVRRLNRRAFRRSEIDTSAL